METNGFYSTKDLLARYSLKATRTISQWRKHRGFPAPSVHCRGGKSLYAKEVVHNWESKGKAA